MSDEDTIEWPRNYKSSIGDERSDTLRIKGEYVHYNRYADEPFRAHTNEFSQPFYKHQAKTADMMDEMMRANVRRTIDGMSDADKLKVAAVYSQLKELVDTACMPSRYALALLSLDLHDHDKANGNPAMPTTHNKETP